MKTNRREFIKSSALASASVLVPGFLKSAAKNFSPKGYNGKSLVIIQLSGGNDGLNCLVPFRNDFYYESRPDIGLGEEDLIGITDHAAFNKNLEVLAQLFDGGNLSVINNVGYPNPNRSHFRSMDIWHSASDADKYVQSGWLGRYLDSTCSPGCSKPHLALEIDETLSLALKGENLKGLAFRSPETLHLLSSNPLLMKEGENNVSQNSMHPQVDYLHKTLAETTQSAEYIYQHSKIYKSKSAYPNHDFGKRMKLIAELIISNSETSVYYVSLAGFDTHVFQKGTQNRLLKVYSDAIKSFCNDLKSNNRFNDTLIMTFSEFGRRVKQNSSRGTDHGTANNIYVIGGKLSKPGMYNDLPDLKKLDNGDLIYNIDFRNVYATVLQKWLEINPDFILKKKFDALSFI